MYLYCVYDWYYKRSEYINGLYIFVLMWIKKDDNNNNSYDK